MGRQIDFRDPFADGDFDSVAELAAHRCGAGIAIVSVANHQPSSHKAMFGATPSISIFASDGTVVPVAERQRLAHPEVAVEQGLAFYIGVPLRNSDGENLGTLAVLDRQPCELDDAAVADLKLLAKIVSESIEMRLQACAQILAMGAETLSRGPQR